MLHLTSLKHSEIHVGSTSNDNYSNENSKQWVKISKDNNSAPAPRLLAHFSAVVVQRRCELFYFTF